jgi:peroxiredoxin
MTDARRKPAQSLKPIIIPGILAILAVLAFRFYQNHNQRFVGTTPHNFPDAGTWIGVDKPLSLANLRGKVVLMQFSFISCPCCRDMDPHLHKWHQEFATDGLVVVEVDDGGSDSLEEVRSWASASDISYPVYFDAGGRLIESYDIHVFPTILLVGRDGKIAFESQGSNGDEGASQLENEIRKELKRPIRN